MSYKTYTFPHPVLGPLTGRLVENDSVVHFRSIPYATIPARFRPSEPLSAIPETFDHRPHRQFTEYGFACPGRPHDPSDLPGELPRQYDEFKCLTLTISAIKSQLDIVSSGSLEQLNHLQKLPVLIYLHGGAFTEGAGHISSMHETIRLASFSITDSSTPTILISIGYRLGAFAGLASQDLLDEAIENGDEEIFNQGLFDQRKALLWVKKFIGGFGGDEDRVTVFGESAGSMSIALHLLADEPLFSRCAMQSGNIATFGRTLKWDEVNGIYQKLLKSVGGDAGGSKEQRLEVLRNIPQERLWEEFIGIGGAIMETYYGSEGTFFKKLEGVVPVYSNHVELTAKREWVDGVIVGDDFWEGYIFRNGLTHAKHKKFVKMFKTVFGEEMGTKILNSYDIEPEEGVWMDQMKFFVRLMYLIGDLFFQQPTVQMVDGLSKAYYNPQASGDGRRQKVFRYQFNLPNPWPGSPFSYVSGHHFVEMFYQFMTFRERYPTHRNKFYQRQSEEMARLWIAFANGKDQWEEYKEQTGYKIQICDDVNGWHSRTRDEDMERSKDEQWGERRYKQWELITEGFENLEKEGGKEKVEWARRKLWDMNGYMDDEDFVFSFGKKED
ncbi:hypothetical protein TWF569_005175 [Orbilia oligospora]|nr:hypothetical protein TWF706_007919 [Orbilia oligospora]KAF3146997.1 hypothetical protein TWF594_003048 [Orbilia oligospora]KAF3149096.1 hypothetical protein TWF569_005175 [Orbilia oligospora]